jgi:hypothetical protein
VAGGQGGRVLCPIFVIFHVRGDYQFRQVPSRPANMKSTGEPRCSENEQVRFGGRPSEKGHSGTSLAAHPTLRTDSVGARG